LRTLPGEEGYLEEGVCAASDRGIKITEKELPKRGLLGGGRFRGCLGIYCVVCTSEAQKEESGQLVRVIWGVHEESIRRGAFVCDGSSRGIKRQKFLGRGYPKGGGYSVLRVRRGCLGVYPVVCPEEA